MEFIERLRQQKAAAGLQSSRRREAELETESRRKSEAAVAEAAVQQQAAKDKLVLEDYHVNDALSTYKDTAWNGHGTISPAGRPVGLELVGYKVIEAQRLMPVRTMTLPTGSSRNGDYHPGGSYYISDWKPGPYFGQPDRHSLIPERHIINVVVENINSISVYSYSELLQMDGEYAKYAPTHWRRYGVYSSIAKNNKELEDFLELDFQKRLATYNVPDFGTSEELSRHGVLINLASDSSFYLRAFLKDVKGEV